MNYKIINLFTSNFQFRRALQVSMNHWLEWETGLWPCQLVWFENLSKEWLNHWGVLPTRGHVTLNAYILIYYYYYSFVWIREICPLITLEIPLLSSINWHIIMLPPRFDFCWFEIFLTMSDGTQQPIRFSTPL